MNSRLLWSILVLVLYITTSLTLASYPKSDNSISFDKPMEVALNIGTQIIFLLPPIILACFNHIAVRIIAVIYLGLILISVFFLTIILAIASPYVLSVIFGVLTGIATIVTIVLTFTTYRKAL
ncbi:hypothetical protein [Staphylococcus massiliensis]|uniref:Uncharacterized protein n=1 Tax=Staphylococcus massiliensis S46 TaxID=1229783 RepID=K9ALM1_9STAP|nr:hypothetical protein [Staphylococcus massiliensis]EKU48204.1 hypothetical protein C273_05842 [Staphylococcus massiliensis S46]MCG3399534.1 hypothetical protein [Staphylococcus massiliensis]MCG3402043.1 hypothetical protein [Staphylococcus massiliensis]MCG3412706.1 hypothetical protein [Staphylococcus massiliensis]POA00749.1 hypothetical protein CD133_03525 [Staphylococcus massiliensis CCUG 55927]